MKYFVCVLLILSATNVVAAQVADCGNISDPDERLACYDLRYPQPEAAAEAPPPVIESESVTPKQEVGQSSDVPPPPPAEAAETEATTLLGGTKVDLTSTIKAIGGGEKQKMIFLLDNEEVWMQSTPRSLPFQEGDTVTIKSSMLGGYYMRSEQGTGTRVQRVE